MKGAFAIAALAGLAAAVPAPQVTAVISPKESTPAGCSPNYSGEFQISIVNVSSSSKRDLTARKALTITLKDGVLTDDENRTGYIASNNQFQFDGPAQTGAIYTAGWSVCSNGTLALGNSAIFYQCLSGTFYNLYDESTGAQCSPIFIDVIGGSSVASASATQISDGQVQVSTSYPAVSQITDGQIQATTGKGDPVTQISDGQIQATTGTAAVVTQISDGQIQATTGKADPVTQISDGQIQAPTAGAVVSQISDGQIQATTGKADPVTQISDGQIQAPTAGAVVSQISDGQIQAPKTTGNVVSQISDGQIQAATSAGTITAGASKNGTLAAPTLSTYTGAAALPTFGAGVLAAAGALAVAML